MWILKKNLKLLVGIGIVLTVVLTVVLAAALLLPKPVPKLINKPKITSPTLTLEKLIKTTFTASRYKDIVGYTTLAFNEKSPDKSYSYYTTIYSKILKAYKSSKNPQYNLVLLRVKQYSKIYPQFKDTDFPSP
ncbi:hypothetical protein HYW41_03075 [Candidatus Daviesbacteria bacterium]|nr:hypothetical protein [Candidatus Daviesbacteria bacterium]